jgi:hypothetical protein
LVLLALLQTRPSSLVAILHSWQCCSILQCSVISVFEKWIIKSSKCYFLHGCLCASCFSNFWRACFVSLFDSLGVPLLPCKLLQFTYAPTSQTISYTWPWRPADGNSEWRWAFSRPLMMIKSWNPTKDNVVKEKVAENWKRFGGQGANAEMGSTSSCTVKRDWNTGMETRYYSQTNNQKLGICPSSLKLEWIRGIFDVSCYKPNVVRFGCLSSTRAQYRWH